MTVRIIRCDLNGALGVFLVFSMILIGLVGCASLDEGRERTREAYLNREAPRIESFHASRTILPRTEWRIYLNGSDANGDLRYIDIWAGVPWGSTSTRLDIDQEQARSVSGYIVFDALRFFDFSPLWVRLRVTLEDREGHRSKPVEVVATFSAARRTDSPPQGVFQERYLGQVPVEDIPDALGPGR